MRLHVLSLVALLAAVTVFGGCNGGRSVLPGTSQPVRTGSGAKLVLSGTIVGSGPQLLGHVRRPAYGSRHRLSFTFNHILVQGTLFPGDAGDNVIINSTTIPVPSGGVFSASVPFSNVPVHNNEWAMLQFAGVASDGSQIALGELAGIINVTSSTTNTSTLTDATSQTFQVFLMLLQNGEIGTNDLDTSSTLNSTLATDIAGTHITPDATTKLFTAGALTSIFNAVAPSFERNVTISASPATNGSYILLRDYTNASELDLVSNLSNFFQTFSLNVQLPKIGEVFGGSLVNCGGFAASIPIHSPETNPAPVPSDVNSCVIAGGIGSIMVRNVYGGHVLIGATNDPFSLFSPITPPFNGGFTSFAGHAPGTFSVSVPTAATQQSIKVTDPAGFAFGAAFFQAQPPFLGAFFLQPNFGNAPMSAAFFTTSALTTFRILVPTPYSSTSNTLMVDTLSPWDISTANMQMCGGISCFALSAPQPLAIQRRFADAGTKLSFFNWKTGGTATAISQATGGYKVTISGPGTATLTTTTASVLSPRQKVAISGTFFPPSTWTVTAKDAMSNTYANSAAAGPGTVTIEMDSVGNTVATTQIVISFTTISAGSITITSINAE